MAYYTSPSRGGGYSFESDASTTPDVQAKPLSKLANIAGAAMSVALIIGIAVWGYKLLMRDVTGIPVVRAAAGDMRVRPENPGGQLADNQGLSVNAVASEGTASQFAEQVILAPKPLDLEDEDQPFAVAMVSSEPQVPAPEKLEPMKVAALQTGNISDVSASLPVGIEPVIDAVDPLDEGEGTIEPIAESETLELDPLELAVSQAVAVAMGGEPGVHSSLRPKRRPATSEIVTRASFQPADTPMIAVPASVTELAADSLPKGTRLVQLGAFDTPQTARAQWDTLNGRFGAYLDGKSRVIQEASSGGRTFYRLRAHGFADIADARRFCSALVAENADCIPVVTR